MIGFLPIWSENKPQKGTKTNCIREKDADNSVTMVGFAPNDRAMNGWIGINIPNPSKSRKTMEIDINKMWYWWFFLFNYRFQCTTNFYINMCFNMWN